MSVQENLLPNPGIVGRGAWRLASPGGERRRRPTTLDRLDVRPPDPAALIEWLSGGNQQKVFCGRWLESQGAAVRDGGANGGRRHWREVRDPRAAAWRGEAGAAILVVSSDFEEVATLCDRALVIGRGQIAGELHGAA